MAESLVIRLGSPLEWMVSGDETLHLEADPDSADELKSRIAPGNTVVVVPGERVLLTSATVPSRNPRQIAQAIPNLIEDELAVDIDACHFAVGVRRDSGEVPVAVVDKAQMRLWTGLLDSLGVKTGTLAIDTQLAHAPASDGIAVTIEGDRAHLLSDAGIGLTTRSELLAFSVGLVTGRSELDVYLSETDEKNLELQLAGLDADDELTLTRHVDSPVTLATLAQNGPRNAINLLQGDYEVKQEYRGAGVVWRTAAVLAGCTFLLHLALTLGQAIYLELTAASLEQQAMTLYQDVFPRDRNVRDLRRRWNAHLGGGGTVGDGEFLKLIQDTAPSIPGSNLTVTNINYNESRGLVLQLSAARSEQLVLFSETLNKMGLEAEIGTISQQDAEVRGSVKVRPFGSS